MKWYKQTNNQLNYALEHLHSAVSVIKTGSCPMVIGWWVGSRSISSSSQGAPCLILMTTSFSCLLRSLAINVNCPCKHMRFKAKNILWLCNEQWEPWFNYNCVISKCERKRSIATTMTAKTQPTTKMLRSIQYECHKNYNRHLWATICAREKKTPFVNN